MSRRWVVDASPLILLGKIDRIALLGRLADPVMIPDAAAPVVAELRRAGLYVADDLVVKALGHLGEEPVR